MSDVMHNAEAAKRLVENADFTGICEEIRAEAAALFLNASSDMVAITKAHERVKAVQLFLDAMTARIDAAKIEERKKEKAQHRGND